MHALTRAAICIAALFGAVALALGGTLSAYTASAVTASSTFTGIPDWTAPATGAAVIGRSTAYDTGDIAQGTTYYVYANVGDTGNPASGIASITANVASITSGSTAVALTAGSYSGGGTAYGYRSAALTAPSSLSAGSRSFTITATDKAANAATQSFTTVVDDTAPTAVDVQSTNVSGGTVGHLDLGDTLTLTFSGVMDPYSILAGWTGAATAVQVALVDGGGTTSDYLVVYNTAASPVQIPLGTIYLDSPNYLKTGTGNYVTFGATGSGTASTITRSGGAITVALGTPSAATSTNSTAAAMSWTPSTAATDIAGNPVTATAATQSGTVHANF
jgi:hypothetical protein